LSIRRGLYLVDVAAIFAMGWIGKYGAQADNVYGAATSIASIVLIGAFALLVKKGMPNAEIGEKTPVSTPQSRDERAGVGEDGEDQGAITSGEPVRSD
jgi:hypothetical protein